MSRRSRCSRLISAGCLLFLLTLCAPPLTAQRVVAIGDVHGDRDHFVAILRQAGIIDAGNRWAGGRTTLVQTGDLLDRGPQSRAVLELMMALEKQAPKSGGRVVALLGNHEMMNVMGDLRYTSVQEFASYADANSEKRRRQALADYRQWAQRHGTTEFTAAMETDWLATHPLGYVEHRAAFAPGGKYGKWLRQRPAMYKTADTVFVHGGIHPDFAAHSPATINAQAAGELVAFDNARALLLEQGAILPWFTLKETLAAAQEISGKAVTPQPRAAGSAAANAALLKELLAYQQWLTVRRDGPLWFRGFAEWSDAEGPAQVTSMLGAQHAARVVVGHSTHAGRILPRWNNTVFLIDTGMNSAYAPGGRGSALEIDGGQITAIYDDGRVVLAPKPVEPPRGGQEPPPASVSAASPPAWLGADGKPLPFSSNAELLEFLRTAKVVEDKGIPMGITGPRRLLLEQGGIRAHAVWRQINEEKAIAQIGLANEMYFRDSYIFEPAAYELSRMLGMNNVPPAVLRTYQGNAGSVQLWVENAITETARREKKLEPSDAASWNRQLNRMNVFDELIYNTDRNRGNILFTPDWNVWLIDHTRTFRRLGSLQDPKKITRCERTLFENMKALDEPTLQQRLGPYLRKVEIRSLLKRRDIIVKLLNKLAAEKGEAAVFYTLEPPQPESHQ